MKSNAYKLYGLDFFKYVIKRIGMTAWSSDNILIPNPKVKYIYEDINESPEENAEFFRRLVGLVSSYNNTNVWSNDLPSIWLRDFMPIIFKNNFYKFRQSYSYMTKFEIEQFQRNYNKFYKDDSFLKSFSFRDIDITLDGGNFITNDDIIFISKKIFSDNKHIKKKDLHEQLIKIFETEKIYYLRTEPEDKTGHVDGLIRFVRPGLILMNDLRGFHNDIHDHNINILNSINGIEYHLLPYMPKNKKLYGWWTNEGNYANFLLNKSAIILSSFGDYKTEIKVERIINKLCPDLKLFFINTAPIDKYGGGLNCISWQW